MVDIDQHSQHYQFVIVKVLHYPPKYAIMLLSFL